eukprot:TRINITY_DN3008_c0_g1_i1.p1 TRINITY_DN3008_c0_g1~~TRINITY_DN3008_c0_g1_i1.p1  ORF type:complete len:287 (+),score=44.95 TRINITY_DN3008_c0_g1_i1:69-929(+)
MGSSSSRSADRQAVYRDPRSPTPAVQRTPLRTQPLLAHERQVLHSSKTLNVPQTSETLRQRDMILRSKGHLDLTSETELVQPSQGAMSLDPRSPNQTIDRTPIRRSLPSLIVDDPRSPTPAIARTPIQAHEDNVKEPVDDGVNNNTTAAEEYEDDHTCVSEDDVLPTRALASTETNRLQRETSSKLEARGLGLRTSLQISLDDALDEAASESTQTVVESKESVVVAVKQTKAIRPRSALGARNGRPSTPRAKGQRANETQPLRANTVKTEQKLTFNNSSPAQGLRV